MGMARARQAPISVTHASRTGRIAARRLSSAGVRARRQASYTIRAARAASTRSGVGRVTMAGILNLCDAHTREVMDMTDTTPRRAHLIAGGFPPGSQAGHDHDYARL